MQTPKMILGSCYALFILCVLSQAYILSAFLDLTALSIAGFVAMLIALIGVYGVRKRVSGSYLETHARWQIRSFWIATAVWWPALALLAGVYLGMTTDTSYLIPALWSGDVFEVLTALSAYEIENRTALFYASIVTSTPIVIWWLARMVRGYMWMEKIEPVPNPNSWLI